MTKSAAISIYLTKDEYPRLDAIAVEQRRSISATMRVLFEDALNGVVTPDLSKRVKPDDAKRANMNVDQPFKERLDAYKASSEGLSMSEILVRIIEAYETKDFPQKAGKSSTENLSSPNPGSSKSTQGALK